MSRGQWISGIILLALTLTLMAVNVMYKNYGWVVAMGITGAVVVWGFVKYGDKSQ